ncbi:MAG: hypothetical protein H6555_06315 [Lewinellaceae bacterium]|nr:hypothetical protein [Lewinellaceae bacterium]
MKKVTLLVFVALTAVMCTVDQLDNPLDNQLIALLQRISPDGTLSHFVLPNSTDLEAIPQGPQNALSPAKIKLGKMLFYETGLARKARQASGIGTFSCSTCHVPASGFMPGRVQGIADGGQGFGQKGESRGKLSAYAETEIDVQGARPLSLLNVAYVTNTTWSGKFGAFHKNAGTENLWGKDPTTAVNKLGLDGLEAQNIEGLRIHRFVVDKYVLDTLGYRSMFDEAFGDWDVAERYSELATSFAISAYLRTLLPTEAPYQRWLRGDELALNEQEKRGAILFYSKAGCYRCHQGAALSSNEFYALGVGDLYQTGQAFATGPNDIRNRGRGGYTLKYEDMCKFKVPQIYNMADSPFYFHGSSKRSLREVVEYFNNAVPENPNAPEENISPLFHPLNLTPGEITDLTAFLSNGLRDPNLRRYVPERVLSGNCFPNNDPLAKKDMGCN